MSNELQPRYLIKTTVPPAEIPVSIDEVKGELTLGDNCTFDSVLNRYIPAAVDWVQEFMGQRLITQTVEYVLDYFPFWQPTGGNLCTGYVGQYQSQTTDERPIVLEVGPVRSVDSVSYYDRASVLQTLSTDDYYTTLGDAITQCQINAMDNHYWPSRDAVRDSEAVQIVAVVGYGDTPSAVPIAIRNVMISMVAHWFMNRGGGCACAGDAAKGIGAAALLGPYKRVAFAHG